MIFLGFFCPAFVLVVERRASGAAGSGSEERASAVCRRLHADVRCSLRLTVGLATRPVSELLPESKGTGQTDQQ
jgi:hypothetical protein